MEVLVLTTAPAGRSVLPALDLLDHRVRATAPSVTAFLAAGRCDVVVVDGRRQPHAALELAALVATAARGTPVVFVADEAGLTGLPRGHGVAQLVLADAGPAEVDARLRLARRGFGPRPGTGREHSEVVRVGPFELDAHAYTIRLQQRPLPLTHREFELLGALLADAGRPLSRERLLGLVDGDGTSPRAVDCHIRAIRAKLGAHRGSIRTVRGLGYVVPAGCPASDAPGGSRGRT
ncbi:response regulator transcription factor [Pseudonocardia kujensis]|uniref:winged helix-turn-helix domain-containing protein n=1 Tax=Pseudonocardia kujensis TaxID=1128675 RepID=UPI001E2BCF5C|nr:response regulator transcription factor [Pseudonocardia kujensis]MCE0763771.1 response regulator transcription factor [Pseudonocardia kujensis]